MVCYMTGIICKSLDKFVQAQTTKLSVRYFILVNSVPYACRYFVQRRNQASYPAKYSSVTSLFTICCRQFNFWTRPATSSVRPLLICVKSATMQASCLYPRMLRCFWVSEPKNNFCSHSYLILYALVNIYSLSTNKECTSYLTSLFVFAAISLG